MIKTNTMIHIQQIKITEPIVSIGIINIKHDIRINMEFLLANGIRQAWLHIYKNRRYGKQALVMKTYWGAKKRGLRYTLKEAWTDINKEDYKEIINCFEFMDASSYYENNKSGAYTGD